MRQIIRSIYYTFGVLLLVNTTLLAQNKTAKKTYEKLGYKTSIPQFSTDSDLSLDEMRKVANSYRLNHETQNAELWYSEVVKTSEEATDFLHYAQALQSNEKFAEAKTYFLKYDDLLGGDNKDQRGKMLAAAIDRMNEFRHSDVEVKNEKILNTEKLDFSPSYYKNGLIFVSTREANDVAMEESKDIWIDDNFMNLFHADINEDGTLNEPDLYSLNLTTKYHEGPVAFNRSGDRIFFTRNDYNKGKRRNNSKGIMKLQIYTSTRNGKDWSAPEELPFNTKEYEEAHPSLSPDGKWLYFASDREGGFGGMDLYVSKFADGKWNEPINLGEEVNTAGNEVFPFAHDDGTIYFSSNGWGGLGGLDMFATRMTDDTSWMKADNIGTPFNSPMDDFGLIMNILGTEGYFTSARHDGYGQDDIYSFKRKINQKIQTKICTYKSTDNQRIEGVEVTVMEATNLMDRAFDDHTLTLVETDNEDEYLLKFKKENTVNRTTNNNVYTTDANGEFRLELVPDKEYLFVAKKDGYVIAEEKFSTVGKNYINDGIDFCIPLEASNCMQLKGLAKNKKFNNILANVEVTMVNICTGDQFTTQTDSKGLFDFPCVDCGCEFALKGEKKHFSRGTDMTSTVGKDCSNGGYLEVLLELEPMDPNAPPAPENVVLPTTIINVPAPPSYPNYPNPAPPTFEGNELKVGSLIELKNIFYDFDQFYIRDGDAQRDLDKVVSLMKQYPTMMIELSSHTDARGTTKYNKKLSKNRARAAVDYIISQGIELRRITARGYGEKHLRNHCANQVDCTEEEHQFNRRTEVKITQFNEPNVDYKYIDNKPEKIDRADSKRKFVWD